MSTQTLLHRLAEEGWLPDALCRLGIRRLCRATQALHTRGRSDERRARLAAWVETMDASPVAMAPKESNEQHYEVPSAFFAEVLGPHRKYSCSYWGEGVTSLADAEQAALEISCERAELRDGQRILELGCGWGSLTLFMASQYPKAQITAVSHSRTQRETILELAAERGLTNVEVITCDLNDFEPPDAGQYDRVVSIEMFEHMRNYRELLRRISTWLTPQGKLFVHIFCHREAAYPYVDNGDPNDWMTRHFFAGGMMPANDLFQHFPDHMRLEQQWRWDGTHYEKTSNAWLHNMDLVKARCWPLFEATYGEDAQRWWGRWRLFFMACAEFFGLEGGEEWWVSHYRFSNQRSQANEGLDDAGASASGSD